MEEIIIPISKEDLEKLSQICEKYGLDNINDCINMALAQIIYIYKGS